MNTEKRQALRAAIEEKIKSLREDIEAFEELARPVPPDNAIGRLTRMEAINAQSINAAALRKAQHTLARLERVLPQVALDVVYSSCQRRWSRRYRSSDVPRS